MKIGKAFLVTSMIALGAIAQTSEYDVRLGGKTYTAKDGEPVAVVTPSGEKLQLVVEKRNVLKFSDPDISFSHGSDMEVTSETDEGIKTITAECVDSTLFMVQVLPDKAPSNEAMDRLLDSFQEEFTKLKATFPKDRIVVARRNIGGTERTGKKLRFSLGEYRHETEVYAFGNGDKTFSFTFQSDHEDREAAEKRFKVITDSFVWTKSPGK